jgi:ABC-type Mn2+/Zn2+ transport system ATPase subunit
LADDALLALDEVRAGYEEVEVLRGVSLRVARGHIVSTIGANGAGKSTLLRTVFGMMRLRGGSIRFAGEEIADRSPVEILARGISYVPQGRGEPRDGRLDVERSPRAARHRGNDEPLPDARRQARSAGRELLDDPEVRQHYLGG